MNDTFSYPVREHLLLASLSSHGFTKRDALKVVLPPLLAFVLFVITLFGIVLPESRKNLIEQKKTAITELTQTAWNVLAHYEQQSAQGKLSVETAQKEARQQIRGLRYGPEGKDYFWINDIQPRMIMHPYRSDLEGKDISAYSDPAGKLLFMDFVSVAKNYGSGFVPYQWQWKDDPDRFALKLSYIKLFEPWGWIVGTGVYLEDVNEEINRISGKSVTISLGILGIITLLSSFIVLRGVKEKRRLMSAEQELALYQSSLENLVEERTAELQEAHSKIKILGGFLPICASCKKIRDDRGFWNQIESYIRDHSEAEFSHGICPECARELYPEIFGKKDND